MKVALVGIGKIAIDQHVPAIAASQDWELAATVSRNGSVAGIEAFSDFAAFLSARPDVGVVSLCLPPVPRYGYAEAALLAGRHVMLEKPPGATLAEVHALTALAGARGLTLYATWHSRMALAVAPAKAWLAGKRVQKAHITWREDVRRWHPGQDWVFAPGGMGVFDPGINALSILTRILPGVPALLDAELSYPANCETPIAARLSLTTSSGAPVRADFDFRHTGTQTWDIAVVTDAGTLTLSMGASALKIDDRSVDIPTGEEYPGLYAHFADVVRRRAIDVDVAPLQLVADAFLSGRRVVVEPFVD